MRKKAQPCAADRRKYPRVNAPVYCRPAGLRVFDENPRPVDISLGGMRIYSDEPVKRGERLVLELFLPDKTTVTCKAEVVWIENLPGGSPALYDVGLHFTHIDNVDRARLSAVLSDEASPPASPETGLSG